MIPSTNGGTSSMSNKSDDKRARWLNIMDDFSQSGQTISAYCNEHSISVATFSYWKKKLLHQSQEVPEFVQISANNQFLLPFQVPSPVIIHMGSIEICISDNCHPELLESLFGILSKHA